ncbi:MAG TPA: hypothetical protein VKF63_14555 [Terracidiphilus sp.]|nr:hypothetical protein [Terracidiphilus sp.]
MRVFSATQAISPAIDRTKRYLFQPFKLGTYLKLTAVACITEGISANSNFNFNLPSGSHTSSGADIPSSLNLSNEVIALIVIGVLVCIAIGIYLSYLIIRLRFAFFHCLAHQTKEIRLGWRLYRTQGMRYFIASLIIGLIFLFVLVLVALPFVFGFVRLFQSSQEGGPFNIGFFLLLFLPLIGIVICLCLAAYAVNAVLHDFILPHMALENLTVLQSWAAAKTRIGAEKGSFALYLLMRLILPFAAYIAVFIVMFIPLLIVFGILVLTGVGFHAAFEGTTGVIAFIGIFIEVVLVLIGIIFGLLVAFSLGGPVATWIRNYALLFYGGRYQALGDILSPPAPAAPAAPEVR